MDPLKELLDIYFDELTPGVRNYISNSDWLDRLQKLKDEYQLNADQYNTLLTEVTLALFGLTDYVALEVNLRPDLPANIAKPLAEKIETEIFNPIKDQLEDRHEKNKKLDQRAEQLEKLPEQLKQLINSEQTLNSIKLIGGRHKLHMDQIGQLADETFKVVTGETKPYSYVNNLEEKLEIDHELANQITKEINKEIFEPIRQQLKEVHNVGQTTKNQEKPEQKEPKKDFYINSILLTTGRW